MNCFKCGRELKYNDGICLECYIKIKNDGELSFISLLDEKRRNSIDWIFTTRKYGNVSFVEDYFIQIDDDIEGGKISALYTGLLKNNNPYGSGLYLFENGVRYFGEYSPKGKLVKGITIVKDAYEEGLYENFVLHKGITILEDDFELHKSDNEEKKVVASYIFECSICGYKNENIIQNVCPLCHAPAEKYNKLSNSQITQDDYLIRLINDKAKLSESDGKEMTKRGHELLRAGVNDKAIKFIKYAAQHGVPDAEILMGDCYNNGTGV